MLDAPDALRLSTAAKYLADLHVRASEELSRQSRQWGQWAKDTRRPGGDTSVLDVSEVTLADYVGELLQLSIGVDAGAAGIAEMALYNLAFCKGIDLAGASLPRPATVVSVQPSGRDASEIHLRVDADSVDVVLPRGGQHIGLIVQVGGVVLRRSYSLCRPPSWVRETGLLAIAVRSSEFGLASSKLVESTSPGERMLVSDPQGAMTTGVLGDEITSLALIGVGSGVTPLASIAGEVLESHPTASVSLVLVERQSTDLMLSDALEELRDRFQTRFRLSVIETRGSGGRIRPDAQLLAARVAELQQGREITAAFICGPDTVANAAVEAMGTLGLPAERIHRESFGVGQGASAPRPGGEATVVIEGEEAVLSVEPGETLLVAALRTGLGVPFSCLAGACGTCRIKVTCGDVGPRAPEVVGEADDRDGWVLACQAAPV